jgi:hypothetical protein
MYQSAIPSLVTQSGWQVTITSNKITVGKWRGWVGAHFSGTEASAQIVLQAELANRWLDQAGCSVYSVMMLL